MTLKFTDMGSGFLFCRKKPSIASGRLMPGWLVCIHSNEDEAGEMWDVIGSHPFVECQPQICKSLEEALTVAKTLIEGWS